MSKENMIKRELQSDINEIKELLSNSNSTEKELKDKVEERLKFRKGKSIKEWFSGWLPEKLVVLMLSVVGISNSKQTEELTENDWKHIISFLKSYTLELEGTRSYDAAQTTAGGVSLAECTDKLESLILPGLFFAGEVLDVDGACGGYNLQWAWSSAAKAVEGILSTTL